MLSHSSLHSTAHTQDEKEKRHAITSRQGSLVFGIRISEDKMGNTTCKGRRWAEKQPTVPSGAAHACRTSSYTTWAPNNTWHGWMFANIWGSHQIYTCVLSDVVPAESTLCQTMSSLPTDHPGRQWPCRDVLCRALSLGTPRLLQPGSGEHSGPELLLEPWCQGSSKRGTWAGLD